MYQWTEDNKKAKTYILSVEKKMPVYKEEFRQYTG